MYLEWLGIERGHSKVSRDEGKAKVTVADKTSQDVIGVIDIAWEQTSQNSRYNARNERQLMGCECRIGF